MFDSSFYDNFDEFWYYDYGEKEKSIKKNELLNYNFQKNHFLLASTFLPLNYFSFRVFH